MTPADINRAFATAGIRPPPAPIADVDFIFAKNDVERRWDVIIGQLRELFG